MHSTTPYYLVLCALFCPVPQQVAAFIAPPAATVHTIHPADGGAGLLRLAAEGSGVSGPPYSGPAVKPILDSVTYPSDMKRLDMRQLKQVRSYS
jgi:hypothetical protein